ncbi:MAG: preprotein translocase subunit YajC [Bacteriovoracia bacterium]
MQTHKLLSFSILVAVSAASALTGVAHAEGPAVPAGTAPGAAGVAGAAPGAPQQPSLMGMIVPFALMFVVLYFLSIRPQQKRMQKQQELLKNLAKGDDVVTTSGMIGKITGITEKVVTLEIAKDVRVKMLKSQVSQVVKEQIQELA